MNGREKSGQRFGARPWTALDARGLGGDLRGRGGDPQGSAGRGLRAQGPRRTKGRGSAGAGRSGAHLVAPLEHVLVPVLDGVVDVQELEDPVQPHVVGVALRLLPAQWRALGQ